MTPGPATAKALEGLGVDPVLQVERFGRPKRISPRCWECGHPLSGKPSRKLRRRLCGTCQRELKQAEARRHA